LGQESPHRNTKRKNKRVKPPEILSLKGLEVTEGSQNMGLQESPNRQVTEEKIKVVSKKKKRQEKKG